MSISPLGPRLTVLVLVVLLLGILPPPVAAQDDGEGPTETCPEGLVYDPAQGMCILAEDVTDGIDTADDVTGDDTADANDDASDDTTDIVDEPVDDGTDESSQGVFADPPEQTGAPVTFTVRNCPAGTSATSDLSTQCLEPGANILFRMATETTDVATQTTSTDGVARFEDVQIGEWTFGQELPAGYGESIVFCNGRFDGGAQDIQMDMLLGRAIYLRITADDLADGYADCIWFNLPEQAVNLDDSKGIRADPPAQNGAVIDIVVQNCPAGTTAENLDAAQCPRAGGGIVFTRSSETESAGSISTNSDGGVTFRDVPAGTWAFIETLPEGFGEPQVFCNGNLGLEPGEFQAEIFFGNQFRLTVTSFDLEAGFMDCTVLNIPARGADNGPQIAIQVRRCAKSVDSTAVQNVQAGDLACPDVFPGKEFTLSLDSMHFETDVSRESGQIFFTKIPTNAGSVRAGISVDLGPTEAPVATFCDNDHGTNVFEVITLTFTSGNGIATVLNDGETMRCTWYIKADPPVNPNTTPAPGPGTGGTPEDGAIRIYLRECPATVDLASPDQMTCLQPVTGVDIDVYVGGNPTTTRRVGDRDGSIYLAGVTDLTSDATYRMELTPLPAYGTARLVCDAATISGSGSSSSDLDPVAATFEVPWASSDEVLCFVYYQLPKKQGATGDAAVEDEAVEDVGGAPGDEPAPGAVANGENPPNVLTIQFWTCPDGVDPATDVIDLMAQCAEDAVPRAIAVDGAQASVTGSATWTFAGPTVTALQPDGIGASSAWCSSSWVENGEEGGDFPDTIALDDGTLAITVGHPQTTVYCDWFLFDAGAITAPPVADVPHAA